MAASDYDALPRVAANHQPLTPLLFLERTAEVFPGHVAVIHGALRRSYAELRMRCVKLAHALHQRGLGRGDTVAALLPNTPAMLECHYGVPMAGCVLNTINTRLDAATIAYILDHGEARIVIVDREFIPVLRAADHPAIAALERIAAQGKAVTGVIVGFENRWALLNLEANHPGGLSARAIARLRASEALTVEDYRAALATREEMRAAMVRLAPVVDALIVPAAPGIAPLWDPEDTQNPRPTGDIAANAATSALGVPCVTLPVMAVEGMPFGAQLIGQAHADARVAAMARWMLGAL